MNSVPCFVGLDYHQDSVQVCVLDEKGKQLLNRSCENDWRNIVSAVSRVGAVQRAAIEACGGSADLADELVQQAGWSVDVAHPGYVGRMKRSPDKSDYSDSRMLADLTRVGYLPKVWLAPAAVRELRQMVNFRQQLVDQRRNTKLRVRAVLREQRVKPDAAAGLPWTARWKAWLKNVAPLDATGQWIIDQHLSDMESLNKRIVETEKHLEEMTKDDPLVKRLMEQPGIGPVTAWVMRAFIGRFDRFASGKQLSRYCGLSPCNASSGNRTADSGLVHGANRLLRATVIQAAHRLARTDDRWCRLYCILKSRGKPACVAVAAVANRWMRGLLHRMK